MKLCEFVKTNRVGVNKKGTHRAKNWNITGREAPTTHQANRGKWIDYYA